MLFFWRINDWKKPSIISELGQRQESQSSQGRVGFVTLFARVWIEISFYVLFVLQGKAFDKQMTEDEIWVSFGAI